MQKIYLGLIQNAEELRVVDGSDKEVEFWLNQRKNAPDI